MDGWKALKGSKGVEGLARYPGPRQTWRKKPLQALSIILGSASSRCRATKEVERFHDGGLRDDGGHPGNVANRSLFLNLPGCCPLPLLPHLLDLGLYPRVDV